MISFIDDNSFLANDENDFPDQISVLSEKNVSGKIRQMFTFNPIRKDMNKKQGDTAELEKLRLVFVDEEPAVENQNWFDRFGTKMSTAAGKIEDNIPLRNISTEDFFLRKPVYTKLISNSSFVSSEQTCSDSGIDSDFLLHSDVESDDVVAVFNYNVNELYKKIIYQILHNVGREIPYEVSEETIFSYVQKSFKMSNENHDKLFIDAKRRRSPEYHLNIKIAEAKDLKLSETNEVSNFFVTFYLSSNSNEKHTTSIQETLNPVWNEDFLLPVPKKLDKDTLCLQIWSVSQQINNSDITELKNRSDKKLIGNVCIPMDDIPALGKTMWYSLDKKQEGVLKISMTFKSNKSTHSDLQDHIYLLKTLLLIELDNSKAPLFWWSGNYGIEAGTLLVQHAVQSGLGPIEVALAEWTVYCSVHVDRPLSFTVFITLLEKLVKPIQSANIDKEEVTIFWDATKKLLLSCFRIISEISKTPTLDKMLKRASEVVQILKILSSIQPPCETNLYPWLTHKDPNCDIKELLYDAVTQGANDWFDGILKINVSKDNTDESKMQRLIQIIQLVLNDLQRAGEHYNKIFQENLSFHYTYALYTTYEKRLADIVKPEITSICESLARFRFEESSYSNSKVVWEPQARDNTLFKLYLLLQAFVTFGNDLNFVEKSHIKDFYLWFHGGVTNWLDIGVCKALQRIESAVKIDKLNPFMEATKYSSSADVALKTFHQIKLLWQQLNWFVDTESSYIFFVTIIDRINRCCIFYADKMLERLEEISEHQKLCKEKIEIIQQCCMAVNNIEYVKKCLKPVLDLGIEDVIKKISVLKYRTEAETTLQNIIENTTDTLIAKKANVLDFVAMKMAVAAATLIIEEAESSERDSNTIDTVIQFFNNNLALLYSYLSADNFNISLILEFIWKHLAQNLTQFLETNLQKSPSFFLNLRESLRFIVRSFKQSEQDSKELKRVEDLLYLNSLETNELIHEVHLSRWKEQQAVSSNHEASFGTLIIRCQFLDNQLYIEILKAKNLRGMSTNSTPCNSFTTINLLPEELFRNVVTLKTKTCKGTNTPFYNERFTIKLSSDQRSYNNGLIMFNVRNTDFLRINGNCISEAFLHFDDIPNKSLVKQVQLTLTKPARSDLDALKILQHRESDKAAKDFLKKYKKKIDH